MKKEIMLPAVAWLGGIAGFALRMWELATAYDPQLRLMRSGPTAWLLYGLAAALGLGFVLSCRGMRKMDRTPGKWLNAPSTGFVVLVVCAGFILMASGLVGLWEQSSLYIKDRMILLAGVLSLVGGICALMAGQSCYRNMLTKNTPLLFMGPSFCLLVWLVACYQANARQPEIGLFVWQVLSGVAVVLALYCMVTLAIGKGGAGSACVFSLVGISLTLIALADRPSLSFMLVYLFSLLFLTANSWMLLRGAFGESRSERMPQGADESEQTPAEE